MQIYIFNLNALTVMWCRNKEVRTSSLSASYCWAYGLCGYLWTRGHRDTIDSAPSNAIDEEEEKEEEDDDDEEDEKILLITLDIIDEDFC